MSETRTCFRCGRVGSRAFVPERNATTGEKQSRCVNREACRDRQRPPCTHYSWHAGYVHAGELVVGKPHRSVHTCPACVKASQAYVTAVTGGLPASDLTPFTRKAVTE